MSKYVFFDLEATSDDVERAEILEIAAYKEGAAPFQAFLRVDEPPDESDEIWDLVGFSRAEYLQGAREPSEVLKAFLAYVGDLSLAGHNVLAYDIPVLRRALASAGLPEPQESVLDTLRLAHLVLPSPPEKLSSYRLEDIYRYFNDDAPDRVHEALADVMTNIAVAEALKEEAAKVPMGILRLWATLGLEEARFLGAEASENPEHDLDEVLGVDADAPWISGGDRPLPRVWEDPEAHKMLLGDRREPQLQMMERVHHTLSQGGQLLIEAPTGTGKTRGYLFPLLALGSDEVTPTIVATHTKLLQSQALEELKRLADQGYAVSAVNLKTPRDYLCLDALKEVFEDREAIDSDGRAMVGVLLHYATKGGHDLEALPGFWRTRPGFREVRLRVETNPKRCGQGPEHRHCAYTLVSDRKKRARIWVTNHAWLLTHQAASPEERCCRLVLDEAHNIEDQATASFAAQSSAEVLAAQLRRLYDPNRRTGLFRDHERLARVLGHEPSQDLLAFAGAFRNERAPELSLMLDRLGQDIERFVKQYGRGELKYGVRLDIVPALKSKPEWARIQTELKDARRAVLRLKGELRKVVPRYSRLDYRLDPLYEALDTFANLANNVTEAVEGRLDERVSVLELILTQDDWTILEQPVDLVAHLAPLWANVHGLVLTSATLDLGDDFAYIRRALGLEGAAAEKLPGTLPYDRAYLVIPGHLPEFRGALQKRFIELYKEELSTLLPHAGRSLTLFTSTERLREVGGAVRERLSETGQALYLPLTRKEREDAVSAMRADPASPAHAFGSRAFMEGVDIPNLKLVNLERIPFPVPSRLLEARERLAKDTGLDPWEDIFLPKAVLSFVQAFGRLIRDQRQDAGEGAVILWDKRLVNAFYQARFFDALPDGVNPRAPRTRAEFYDLLAAILGVERERLPHEELLVVAQEKLRSIQTLSADPLRKAARIAEAFWGIDLMRDAERESHQREAIEAALDGRDTLVFLPTGYGKSLTFQLPALVEEGLTLVISPLKALMADQVSKLQDLGLPAAKVDSSMPAAERNAVYDEVRAGHIQLFYVSPERVVRDQGFRKLLEHAQNQGRLRRFVFDEAHTIWEWGQDFRPDYQTAATLLREEFAEVPVSGLTATAVPEFRERVYDLLRLTPEKTTVVLAHPDRKEIRYYTKAARGERAPLLKLKELTQLLAYLEEQGNSASAIVYTTTTKMAERVAWALGRLGFRAEAYHGQLSSLIRSEVQLRFESGETPIIVATKAFGMGIDKADVRAVVHFQPPESLEAYLQGSGRAGRDGRISYALLTHAAGDWRLLEWMLGRRGYSETHVDALVSLIAQGPYWGYVDELLNQVNEVANRGLNEDEARTIGVLELNQILSRASAYGVIESDYLPGKAALLEDDQWAAPELGKTKGSQYHVDFTQLQNPEEANEWASRLYQMWQSGQIKLLRFYEPSLALRILDRDKTIELRNGVEQQRRRALERVQLVRNYASESDCLRAVLLRHLGAEAVECSGCLYHDGGKPPWSLGFEVPMDVIQNAYHPREVLLEFLDWAESRWQHSQHAFPGYGAAKIANTLQGNEHFWTGSDRAQLPWWMVQSPFFGKLAFISGKEIEKLLGRLAKERLVEKKPFGRGATYRITEEGRKTLHRLRQREGRA